MASFASQLGLSALGALVVILAGVMAIFLFRGVRWLFYLVEHIGRHQVETVEHLLSKDDVISVLEEMRDHPETIHLFTVISQTANRDIKVVSNTDNDTEILGLLDKGKEAILNGE